MAGQLILALSILVTLHELGHYAAARAFGIKVEKFYLFFDAWGYKLFSFKYKDTEYGIGWLPFGGYVKIAGMIDESMDTEQMKSEPQDWEFRSKPAWQRLIVMIGGVTVNLILGIVISIFVFWEYGETKLPISKVKYGLYPNENAKEIGFKERDIITGFNGHPFKYFNEIMDPKVLLKDGVEYDVLRDGQTVKVKLPANIIDQVSDKKKPFFELLYPCKIDSVIADGPAFKGGMKDNDFVLAINDTNVSTYQEYARRIPYYSDKTIKVKVERGQDTLDLNIKVSAEGKVGTMVSDPYENDYEQINYTFGQSIPEGTNKAFETLVTQTISMGKLITGKIDPTKSVQGPFGIAKLFGAHWDWERFWTLTSLLSLVLAFMNILPIPALDGGHVVFLIVEMIIRRPLSEKFMQVMQVIGMVILLGLMVFAFGNDLYRIFFK